MTESECIDILIDELLNTARIFVHLRCERVVDFEGIERVRPALAELAHHWIGRETVPRKVVEAVFLTRTLSMEAAPNDPQTRDVADREFRRLGAQVGALFGSFVPTGNVTIDRVAELFGRGAGSIAERIRSHLDYKQPIHEAIKLVQSLEPTWRSSTELPRNVCGILVDVRWRILENAGIDPMTCEDEPLQLALLDLGNAVEDLVRK